MIDDELQVLGKPHKMSKKTKWMISISAIALMILCVVLGMIIHSSLSPQQTIKIKTGKKIGDPTIVPELQATVDSILNANMTEIGNCLQGQAIVMDVETGEILAMS